MHSQRVEARERDWEARIAAIDARLRPLATRPMTSDTWRSPLEEAGVREETEAILFEMIAAYRIADDALRERMRVLFASHTSFAWAATIPFSPMTKETLRDHLVLFSIQDQGRDTRDAILALGALCEEAARLGIDLARDLAEVAALSSDADKYGMGSTRRLLSGFRTLPRT